LEADFACKGGSASAQRPISGGDAFKFTELELTSGLQSGCKTADGKTGKDIVATAQGPLAGTKEEETPAQKARREQLQEMNGQ